MFSNSNCAVWVSLGAGDFLSFPSVKFQQQNLFTVNLYSYFHFFFLFFFCCNYRNGKPCSFSSSCRRAGSCSGNPWVPPVVVVKRLLLRLQPAPNSIQTSFGSIQPTHHGQFSFIPQLMSQFPYRSLLSLRI